MGQPRGILTAEDRLHDLGRAQKAAEQRRLLRQAYEPIYRKYRTVIPSIFTRNGEASVHMVRRDPGGLIERLIEAGVFTLDTAAELRWGIRLVHTPNVSVYLPNADPLNRLADEQVLVRDPSDTFIYASPVRIGPRLFAVVPDEMPPHDTLPSGHRVVTVDRLTREFVGTFGLRLDLLAAFDAFAHPASG